MTATLKRFLAYVRTRYVLVDHHDRYHFVWDAAPLRVMLAAQREQLNVYTSPDPAQREVMSRAAFRQLPMDHGFVFSAPWMDPRQ